MKSKYSRTIAVTIGVLVTLFISWFVAAKALPSNSKIYRHLQIFAAVLSHIEKYYVEPADPEELILGAVNGMVRTLDPHSSLLLPSELEMLEADTRGEFGGVGLEVGIKDNTITVIAPIEDSPAFRAGISPGDQLISVDGYDTAGMSIEEAIRKMRGKPGTAVTVMFVKVGEKKPTEFKLVREIIRIRSVEADEIFPGYLWLRLRSFQEGTTAEVKKHISSRKKTLAGIVFDLRRNPGGLLDEAIRLSDLFLSSGVIVTTRGKNNETIETFHARRLGTIDTPIVLLIDEASASAAEIVAAALMDNGRALSVGNKSFGKGSVQSILSLQHDYGLKLTVARYFTPNGRSIQAEGVVPDVMIETRVPPEKETNNTVISETSLSNHLTPLQKNSDDVLDLNNIEDYQLRVAIGLLMGLSRQNTAK